MQVYQGNQLFCIDKNHGLPENGRKHLKPARLYHHHHALQYSKSLFCYMVDLKVDYLHGK